MMTGPGTNTYLIGQDEIAVIDPGPMSRRIWRHTGCGAAYSLDFGPHTRIVDHSPLAAELRAVRVLYRSDCRRLTMGRQGR